MPAPRTIDLIPAELQAWLRAELVARGFADISGVTEELNRKLEALGSSSRVGRSAVGRYSKELKRHRDAFVLAESLLADMDLGEGGAITRKEALFIATAAARIALATRVPAPDEEG